MCTPTKKIQPAKKITPVKHLIEARIQERRAKDHLIEANKVLNAIELLSGNLFWGPGLDSLMLFHFVGTVVACVATAVA